MTHGRTHAVVESPLGPLTLVAEDGVLSGLYFAEHRHGPPTDMLGRPSAGSFGAVREELDAYFRGTLMEFDVPVSMVGTPFQLNVWRALLTIPYGATVTYGGLAARIGVPGAARAGGLANGRNPVSIVVPCHRVVGSNGRLTGYGGGLARKRALLDLERAAASGMG